MDDVLKAFISEVGSKMSNISRMAQDDKLSNSMRLNVHQLFSENGGNPGNKPGLPSTASMKFDVSDVPDDLKPKTFSEMGIPVDEINQSHQHQHQNQHQHQTLHEPVDDRQMMFDFDKVVKAQDVYDILEKIYSRVKELEEKIDLLIDNHDENI